MRGAKIETVARVCELALERKCVTGGHPAMRRIPAAFLQNMQARLVCRYLRDGLWEYVSSGGIQEEPPPRKDHDVAQCGCPVCRPKKADPS